MNIKHVHQSPESSMYSDTDDLMRNVNRKIEAMMRESGSHSIDTRSTPQEINIAINENAVAMDCIELATDAAECDQEQKSNLSKSLLLTRKNTRERITSDDSMMYYQGNMMKRQRLPRGYTIDSCDFEAIDKLRQVITPYELRKQHSLLRVIDPNQKEEDEQAFDANLLVLTGDMDALDLNVNNKLQGPLYSADDKSDWNDMKKVDIKYANVLKKRRKKQMNVAQPMNNTYLLDGVAMEHTQTVKKTSFWGNISRWFVGNSNQNEDVMMSCDETISSTFTMETTQRSALATPLLKDDDEERDDIQQISFWRDIVLPNWDSLHQSGVVKLFWEREGIPSSCRGQVWYYAIGNRLNIALNAFDSVYSVTKQQMDEYEAFLRDDEPKRKSIFDLEGSGGETLHFCEGLKRKKSIERDMTRLFEDGAHGSHDDIVSVLMAFCNLRSSISYIQFLTHLAQILLQYQSPAIAFISLSNLINQQIFEIYIHCNVSQIRQRIGIFSKMLVYNCSHIARHLQKLTILADTYVMDWCNGLFSAQLPINIVSRIWDLYLLNGEIIIWKSAVALLICINEKLDLVNKSHHKCVKILQSIKKSFLIHNVTLDERYFVKKIYSIKLPRDVRKWFKKKDTSHSAGARANTKKQKKKKKKKRNK
eukprot:625814_1